MFIAGIALVTSMTVGHSQDMYKALKQQHTQRRFGVGLQAFEPTGVSVQMFHGFFCSNDDLYATRAVQELQIGAENVVLGSTTAYKDGTWKKGGLRVEFDYLFPVLTIDYGFVVQTYLGAGIQTGSRHYENVYGDQSAFATGGNLMARLEVGGKGFEAGNDILFWSVYVDAKFHQDFTEDFNYFKPSVGIRIRKAR